MASIDKRPNGKWRARYRLNPGRPQRAKHFDGKTDAERFLARIQGQLLDGSYVDPAAGQINFGAYAGAWQRAQVHRPTTVTQVDAHLRNHIVPAFGDRPIASIRPSEVQAWVRGRAEKLAPSTVEVVYRIFARILADAVADRTITRNPAKGARLPRQAKALIDHRRPAAHPYRNRPTEFGPPKTEASVRTIPLPDVVGTSLGRHVERWPRGPEGLVFTNQHDQAIRRNRFNELWRQATERAGVGRLRFHNGLTRICSRRSMEDIDSIRCCDYDAHNVHTRRLACRPGTPSRREHLCGCTRRRRCCRAIRNGASRSRRLPAVAREGRRLLDGRRDLG